MRDRKSLAQSFLEATASELLEQLLTQLDNQQQRTMYSAFLLYVSNCDKYHLIAAAAAQQQSSRVPSSRAAAVPLIGPSSCENNCCPHKNYKSETVVRYSVHKQDTLSIHWHVVPLSSLNESSRSGSSSQVPTVQHIYTAKQSYPTQGCFFVSGFS